MLLILSVSTNKIYIRDKSDTITKASACRRRLCILWRHQLFLVTSRVNLRSHRMCSNPLY